MSEPNVPPPPSYTPPPPPAGLPPSGAVSPNRGLMLVLSYLPPLSVIPLVVEKDDTEVQWHAKHGLVLFVAEIIIFAILGVVAQIPFLGCLFALAFPLLGLAILLFHIYLIIKANNGERVLVPGISEYANRF